MARESEARHQVAKQRIEGWIYRSSTTLWFLTEQILSWHVAFYVRLAVAERRDEAMQLQQPTETTTESINKALNTLKTI